MGNTNNPHGLQPLGYSLSGGPFVVEEFTKAVGYTALYRYDAVNRVADGSIEASATPGTTAYTGVTLNGGATLTATTHLVIVSPDAVYETQCDDSLVITDMGLNCNLILGAGSATTKKSGHQLDGSTAAESAALDMKLLKLFSIEGNAYGQYGRIEVAFNKHRMAPGVVGI